MHEVGSKFYGWKPFINIFRGSGPKPYPPEYTTPLNEILDTPLLAGAVVLGTSLSQRVQVTRKPKLC